MRKTVFLKWDISSNLIVLILLILFVGSCSTTEENITYGIYPVKQENVSLNIDNETKGFTLNVRFFETANGGEWLLHLNEINNTIGIYDLESGKKVRTAYYETEGPNGAGYVDGFDIISLDSVFLLSGYQELLSLASLNSSDTLQVYESYRLKYTNSRTVATTYSSVRAPIAVINGKAHLATVPFVYLSKTPLYEAGSNFLQLDLAEYTFEYQNLYSKGYLKKWTDPYIKISYDVNEQEKLLVFSLPIEDSIFSIDVQGRKTSHFAKAKNSKSTRPFSGDVMNPKQTSKHYMLNDSYGYILYDKYRNYYYRFTEKVAKEMINKYGTDIYVRKFGIIVMNEDFEIIGETDELFTGSFPSIFVGKKGIYNMLASSDESKMFFELYTFD
ncbi:MAG: DUF4221 domain-containing protein [Roseivirga sp.]